MIPRVRGGGKGDGRGRAQGWSSRKKVQGMNHRPSQVVEGRKVRKSVGVVVPVKTVGKKRVGAGQKLGEKTEAGPQPSSLSGYLQWPRLKEEGDTSPTALTMGGTRQQETEEGYRNKTG